MLILLLLQKRCVNRSNRQCVRPLEDGDVVVDLRLLSLCDTLCDPDDVASLLLLQLEVGVEHAQMELLQKGQRVQLHLRERIMSNVHYLSTVWGHLRDVLVFREMSCKMNRKYSQDVDKVINNDF